MASTLIIFKTLFKQALLSPS